MLHHVLGSHVSQTLGAAVFSPPLPVGGARYLMVQALAQNIRYSLYNGFAPTASTGFRLTSGNDPIIIEIATDVTPQFIRETGGAILEYQWFD